MIPPSSYDSIKAACDQSGAFSRSVIDEFLLYYTARQEGLEKEMEAAYYVEEDHRLFLTSLTDRGFQALAARLNKHGLKLWTEPDVRVNLSMLTCIKTILGEDLQLNPYEEYFTIKPDLAEQDTLNRLNHFLSLALPFINSGLEPDIQALANEARIDIETARKLFSNSIKRIKTLQKKEDKKRKK
jgi:hypothetical protein